MIYAVDRDMDYIKISNKDELDSYLEKYDVENQFEDESICLMLVYDGFLEMKEVYQNLFNAMHTGKLPHLLVITDSDANKHFNMYSDGVSFAKTEFGGLFNIGGEYKPTLISGISGDAE